jgi:general secretion pathway protein D
MDLICMTRLILFLAMGLTAFLHAEDTLVGSNQGDQEDVPSSTQLSSEQIMQKEIDRRRETTFRWNEMLDLGERLYQAGEWKHGEAKYRLVLGETDGQSFSAGFHRRAQIGVAKCLAAEALAKKEEGKPIEAAVLMKQAEDMDPQNPALAKQSAALLEQSSLSDNPFASNPAVTEELMTKTTEIKKLLTLADQLTATGQYKAARDRLDDVLRIDAYNRAARAKIEDLEKKRMSAADVRYRASREKAMAEVTEAWLPPPPAKIDAKKSRSSGVASSSSAAEVMKTLSTITIPELVFNEKPVREAVDELQRLSVQNDPAHRGLNFVLRLPSKTEGKDDPESATVSLELQNVSLQTAVKYLCEQVRGIDKLRSEIEDNAVLLLPVTETGGQLETRSYNLPPSLIANLGTSETDPSKLGNQLLENIGADVKISDSSAICFRETGKLVVRNTANELNKIEQRMRDAQGEPPQRQFEVETKFLQFTENDVKNFTFNLQMSGSTAIPAPGIPGQIYDPGSASGGTDGLRGTAGLRPGGASALALQSLLDPTYPQYASNQVGVNATVFGKGFAAMLQLLQNAIGRDLVASPRVTLPDGKQSKIVISREMYYPTSYTQPTVPNNDQGVGAGFILPSNPTGFEPRNIGVTMEVKGESTSIPKAVDLDFANLLVEDFEGFVNYGANIATVSFGEGPTTTGSTTTVDPVSVPIGQAPYLVPIFSKRSLQTRIRLLDGETVGMGGLIADSIQKVEDKVPGLGDVPLVGRLFRSEVSQKIKSNLVIFCTLRIIKPDGSLAFPDDETNPEYGQDQSAEMMSAIP